MTINMQDDLSLERDGAVNTQSGGVVSSHKSL
jgi:hypothetical protein